MLTFQRLERASFVHSAVYLGLLYAAFAAGKPEPATFGLGLAHGLLWIGMSLACVAAVRRRVIPLHVAVAVAVLGGFGPFVGSLAFVREDRRRRALA
jgi:sulfite exporter TauE/SafE